MNARVLSFVLVLLTCTSVFAQGKGKSKAKMEKPMPTDKPAITRLEPRGIQRGNETKIRLVGTNLLELKQLKSHHTALTGELLPEERSNTEAWIKLTAAAEMKRGAYEISVANEKGESGKVKLYVDDVPQPAELESEKTTATFPVQIPCSFWGTLNPPADTDQVEFEAVRGDTLVFDVSAKSIGSKANINLAVVDSSGKSVASNNNFDGGDPLVSCTIPATGRYRVHISEEQMGGSPDHFYRLSIGNTPVVTGFFPLSVGTNVEAQVTLVGYNVPPGTAVKFSAPATGEVDIPVDSEKFHTRKAMKVLVTENVELIESEPNDEPSRATRITPPCVVGGRITVEATPSTSAQRNKIRGIAHGDVDHFQFDAKAGEVWVVETDAARRGSPVDTQIEVLHPDGKPVERVLLQATRDSHINFRAVDSMTGDVRVENWEEMELNELMYLEGEVCKIFRMPEGPDSGFQFYRNGGKRICYFDTSATARANGSLCYIVEPHPPGTKLVANGLPVFTLYYANDDDGERELGSDSRVQFTAPTAGTYLIRVTDARGHSGEHFSYRLSMRRAHPDFKVTLNNANPTVSPGSGTEFTVAVDRIDGFDGDITVDINGVPEGFLVPKPLVIQAGHLQASGTLCAAADAKEPSSEVMSKVKVTATAAIAGQKIVKDVNTFGQIKLGEKPKLVVAIEPYNEANTNFNARSITEQPLEITIEPGSIVPAWLKVKRNGHEDLVTFTVENLPHGVIVDNIGLNGVLIPKGENERQIFLRCARWVPETDRLAYCQAKQAGNPTSLPILIKVRKSQSQQTAAK